MNYKGEKSEKIVSIVISMDEYFVNPSSKRENSRRCIGK